MNHAENFTKISKIFYSNDKNVIPFKIINHFYDKWQLFENANNYLRSEIFEKKKKMSLSQSMPYRWLFYSNWWLDCMNLFFSQPITGED